MIRYEVKYRCVRSWVPEIEYRWRRIGKKMWQSGYEFDVDTLAYSEHREYYDTDILDMFLRDRMNKLELVIKDCYDDSVEKYMTEAVKTMFIDKLKKLESEKDACDFVSKIVTNRWNKITIDVGEEE